jgi:hypothetical protein
VPLGYPLALPLGGGPDDIEVEQDALLQALEDGLDPTAPEQLALTYAEALGIANVWAINRRLSGQLDPTRMIETLPTWEEACDLRPLPTDTEPDRRAALQARFLGLAGNAISQIYGLCVRLAGATFLGLAMVDPSTENIYLPGINPGPPGCERASDRAAIAVQLVRGGLPDAAFLDLVRRLRLELAILVPAWMKVAIGTFEGGCIPDVAIPDMTLI